MGEPDGQDFGRTPAAARSFSELAALWAELWGGLATPARIRVADAAGIGAGTRVLDIGCGTGELARIATERGAVVSGVDAAEGMVELARSAAPTADLRIAPMDRLPWPDGSFDVVTAFNVFQYAADIAGAFAEAARVLRPGGRIAVCNWGDTRDQDLDRVTDALEALVPAQPGAADHRAVGEAGALEELARSAGLHPEVSGEVAIPYELPDEETLVRAFLLDVALLRADEHLSEETVRTTVLEAAAAYRRADGSYRFENRFRYVVAFS